jgi:site-specific DNA-cytosine methylase
MKNSSTNVQIQHQRPNFGKPMLGAGFKVLVACEESDEVRGRFEALGFDAWSCDLQPNRNPNAKHYQGNIFDIINNGWDAMIAFPPCTDLAVSGAGYFAKKIADGRQQNSIDFFLRIANADIPKIAIENPVGIMSKKFRKPNQIIQPYYFGDEASKKTCLWLKNLPLLKHLKEPNLFESNVTWVDKGKIVNGYPAWMFNNDKKHRSKTFPGIAQAMVDTWSVAIACT